MMQRYSIVALTEDDNSVWFLQNNKNGLYYFDKKIKKLEWIPFLEESFCIPSLYLHLQKMDSNIVCVPHGANKIAIYNTETKNIKYIPLKKNERKSNEFFMPYANFYYSFIHGRDIYMLGYYYPAILIYNVDTDEVRYLDDWLVKIEKKIPENDMRGFFGRGHVYINSDIILLPFACTNGLLKLNMKTNETEVIWVESVHDGIAGISADANGRVWMTGYGIHDDDVVIWKHKSNEYEVKHIPEVRKEKIFSSFYQPIITESRIYFIPIRENHIYSIGMDDENIEVDLSLDNILNTADNTDEPLLKYYLINYNRDTLSIIRSHDLSWHRIMLDTMDDCIQMIDDSELDDIYIEIMSKYEKFDTVVNETTMSVDAFIRYIEKKNN